MFLTQLTLEQKIAFLGLAHHIAMVDGEFEQSEKEMLEYYAIEMDLKNELIQILSSSSKNDFNVSLASLGFSPLTKNLFPTESLIAGFFSDTFNVQTFDIEKALDLFQEKTKQRILVLELMAIVYANNEFHPEQQKVVNFILDVFDFSSHLVTIYSEWAKTMISLQKQGDALVHL